LGHGSITTTEKYLHSMPGANTAALKALDAVRGVRASQSAEEVAAPTPPAEGQAHGSSREMELAELRQMVAKLTKVLGSLGDTA
jgi:hypothetical protein